MDSPVHFLVLYFVLSNYSSLDPVAIVLALIFCFHYFNQTFIFPYRIKEKSNKMPIGIMLLAVILNLLNGIIIGYSLGNFATYTIQRFTGVPFILGSILFVIGLSIN
jgi:3-oxo-5-alpha-steroid 4-dehydrogenase 1